MIERDLVYDVLAWGRDKGILEDSYDAYDSDNLRKRRYAQWSKTSEEVSELLWSIAEHDRVEAKDAIGDIIVTLIMQADLWDTDINSCLQQAYDVISKRKGKMVNGVFVKDKE